MASGRAMNKKNPVRVFVALVAVASFFLFTQKPSSSAVKPASEVQRDIVNDSTVSDQTSADLLEDSSEATSKAFLEPAPTFQQEGAESESPGWQPDDVAVATLRAAVEHGDPRTPPMAQSSEREMPTAEELADPDLYLEYEARQQQQVFTSYLAASKKKISELETSIARAKSEGGVSADQLAEGQAKLEKLKAARDEVIAEHPELATSEDDANSSLSGTEP